MECTISFREVTRDIPHVVVGGYHTWPNQSCIWCALACWFITVHGEITRFVHLLHVPCCLIQTMSSSLLWNSKGTCQWIFQQPMIIEQCFKFYLSFWLWHQKISTIKSNFIKFWQILSTQARQNLKSGTNNRQSACTRDDDIDSYWETTASYRECKAMTFPSYLHILHATKYQT